MRKNISIEKDEAATKIKIYSSGFMMFFDILFSQKFEAEFFQAKKFCMPTL